jgi:hypothetical protein
MKRKGDKCVEWEDLDKDLQQVYLSIQRSEGEPVPRCPTDFDGWACTRPPNHQGPHFAGASRSPHCHIYAIWDEMPEDLRMDIGL